MAKTRWFLRGWELTTGNVRDVESRAGWESLSPGQGENVTIPNRGGYVFRPKRISAGKFSLSFWLAGADETELLSLWGQIIQAAAPLETLTSVRRIDPDGTEWRCEAELTGTIAPTRVADRGIKAMLEFSIPSGQWESATSYTAYSTAGAALPQSLSLPFLAGSSGQASTLFLEVYGPIVNPVIADVTSFGSGHQVSYAGTIPAGGVLRIDSANWNVVAVGFALNPAALQPTAGRYMLIDVPAPGTVPVLQLRGTGGGATTRLGVAGRKVRR